MKRRLWDRDRDSNNNPWGGVRSAPRVTTPPAAVDDYPTVFSGLAGAGAVDKYNNDDKWLSELQDQLEAATLSLTDAEREYIMEFGELPEED